MSKTELIIPPSRMPGHFQFRSLIVAIVLMNSSIALAQTSINSATPLRAEPFPLSRVRLLPGPFKERQDLDARFLFMVDPDRLLAGFRQQAGLAPKAKRYGGWESRDINGHSLGHYLSALSLLYAATGDSRALKRITYIVSELAACQQANGDGYVLPVRKNVYEDIRKGKIEATAFSLNDSWVPNYTLHKVLAGLRDAYRFAGNQQAVEVERKLADWLDGILSGLSEEQIQEMLKTEHGGMNEVLADLAVDTGDKRYFRMAETDFNHQSVLDPLMRGEDRLNGLHGNTQIPKVIGLAREYEISPEPKYREAVETFWDSVVNSRSYAIGGHGEGEHFFPPEKFPDKLTPHTAESCNTYNMLKLTGHLFSWEPKAAQMDFVERALINHLLANIGRQPGEFGYFLGLGSVGMKVFSTKFDSWWCCVGTGMENPTRYGEQIYFHSPNTLWVNLYLGSTLRWAEKGVVLRQETRFPEDDTVRFVVTSKKPVKFLLKLRHPYWCQKPTARVNGKVVPVKSAPSSYMTFERRWKRGDTLQLHLPMTLRLEPLPHSEEKVVAVMYGPMVLAGVVPAEPGVPDAAKERFADHLSARGKTDAFPPVLVAPNVDQVVSHLRSTGKAFAEFRSSNLVKSADLTFIPFYRIYEEHYAVYFPIMKPDEWSRREGELNAERERRAQWDAATVDTVAPGFQQSEVEHGLRSDNTETGDFQDRKWRHARNGGWFSYEMAVDPDAPIVLVSTYWGGEWPERNFDILIDGVKVATQRLRTNKPGDFFDEIYAIPPELTKGKTKVIVRFQAHPNDMAGGVYGLRTMRANAVPRSKP